MIIRSDLHSMKIYQSVPRAYEKTIIGIPMGSDPAPFFANLFLSFYETQWIKSLKRSNYGRAMIFLNTFRFIDDLIIFNNHNNNSNNNNNNNNSNNNTKNTTILCGTENLYLCLPVASGNHFYRFPI